jgi:hypothetical protein
MDAAAARAVPPSVPPQSRPEISSNDQGRYDVGYDPRVFIASVEWRFAG